MSGDATPPRGALRRRAARCARSILDAWDLDIVRSRKRTDEANVIVEVEVADGTRFVLRLTCAWVNHDRHETLCEVAWLRALASDTSLVVPTPIAARSGAYVVPTPLEIAGHYPHACLFTWIPSYTVGSRLTPRQAESLGAYMAALHEHAASFRPGDDFRVRTNDSVFPYAAEGHAGGCEPVVLFERAHAKLYGRGERDLYRRAVDRSEGVIADLYAQSAPPVVTHNDLHPWNLRADRGVLGAIDFEDLMWGHPVQDIATTMYYLRIREQETGRPYEEAYRAGYGVAWPDASPEALDALIAARGLMLVNYVLTNEDAFGAEAGRKWIGTIGARLKRWMGGSGS